MDESTSGTTTYWSHVADAASVEAYRRDEANPLLSAEALPENSSLMDFKSFARDYPEKLFPLLYKLRTEFQELFIEYYLLEKSQSFLAKAHGQIQTRIWQNLRIIEQAVGSLIVLGTEPNTSILQPILIETDVNFTEYGHLSGMIALYAKTQSYAAVAKEYGAPIPAIRRIFRPAIDSLLTSKNLKAVAVGAYLRSLTHLASLTGGGLSKRCIARVRRLKNLRFDAPPSDESPLMSFGAIASLHETPWGMFEISSEHRMTQIFPLLKKYGKRLFNKKAAQIFAPVDGDGELELGYILARSTSPALTRGLIRVRGISEMAANYTNEGAFLNAVTVPNIDVQKMIASRPMPGHTNTRVGDFVEILTGEASRYYGTVIQSKDTDKIIEVSFPSGRRFIVTADSSALRVLPDIPIERRAFWGEKI